jgi:hypothetical protein
VCRRRRRSGDYVVLVGHDNIPATDFRSKVGPIGWSLVHPRRGLSAVIPKTGDSQQVPLVAGRMWGRPSGTTAGFHEIHGRQGKQASPLPHTRRRTSSQVAASLFCSVAGDSAAGGVDREPRWFQRGTNDGILLTVCFIHVRRRYTIIMTCLTNSPFECCLTSKVIESGCCNSRRVLLHNADDRGIRGGSRKMDEKRN